METQTRSKKRFQGTVFRCLGRIQAEFRDHKGDS